MWYFGCQDSSPESISIGLFGKRKTQNLLNISDSIWKNAIGKRVRERERGGISLMVELRSPGPLFQIESWRVIIWEFIVLTKNLFLVLPMEMIQVQIKYYSLGPFMAGTTWGRSGDHQVSQHCSSSPSSVWHCGSLYHSQALVFLASMRKILFTGHSSSLF